MGNKKNSLKTSFPVPPSRGRPLGLTMGKSEDGQTNTSILLSPLESRLLVFVHKGNHVNAAFPRARILFETFQLLEVKEMMTETDI